MPSNSTPLPPGRREEVEGFLDVVRRWARDRRDLRAAALVGSWARDAACADSDVDVVLLTDDQAAYLEEQTWLEALGVREIARTTKWGVVTELRVALESGLEVEFGVTSPEWASTNPVDPGSRIVALEGLVVLHDPEGLLARLVDVVSREA